MLGLLVVALVGAPVGSSARVPVDPKAVEVPGARLAPVDHVPLRCVVAGSFPLID